MNRILAAAAAVSLSSCVFCCIARGALVSTPRGRRPIEDLAEGDTIWSVDPTSGERVASPVLQIRSATREVMRLAGDGFSLRCTTDHPLYDPAAGEWASAGDWVLGKRTSLLFVEDGARPRVVEVVDRVIADGLAEVFDLTVEHDLHNFVAAGVLVHNKSPPSRVRVCETGDGRFVDEFSDCSLPDGGAGLVQCETTLVEDGGVQYPRADCVE